MPIASVHSYLRRRLLWLLIAISIVAALSALDHAGAFGFAADDRSRFEDAVATVTAVVDGATIEIDLPDAGRPATRVHLRGVEPATSHLAQQAATYLEEHAVGQRVRLRLDPNRSSRTADGRLSAYVFIENCGETLNETLITRSLARADRSRPHVLQYHFESREKQARRGARPAGGVPAAASPP